MSRIMARLRSIKMKDRESTRSFARRVRVLLDKINPAPSAEMQAEYFIGGLPRAMNKFVRQHDPANIAEAIRLSQKFVDVEQSQEKELRKEENDEAKRSKKKKKKRKPVTSSEESDLSSSEETSMNSSSSESSSEEESFRKGKKKKDTHKSSNKKEKESKYQRTINELAGKFDKLAVNLADNRAKRRNVPIQRPGVWCTRCQQRGHYPAECTTDLRYVEDLDVEDKFQEIYWTDDMEDVQWRMVQAAQSQPPPRIYGARPQGIGRGTGPMGTKPIPRPPMEPPGGYPDPSKPRIKGTCYNCGDPRHYSPSCPWPKAPKPVPILCGNCGAEGHTPLECPNPAQPKLLVKYVRDPDPKQESEVRLIYIEEAKVEEVNQCQVIDFVEGEVFKTSTRSMKQKDYAELRKEMAKKKSTTKSKKEDPPAGKQSEGLPKELDPAYDRADPKYFLQDISKEAQDLIHEEQAEKKEKDKTPYTPPPKPPSVSKVVKFEGVKIDGRQGYDIFKDVSETRANVTIGELLKENSFYRKQIRPLVTGRKRKYKLPSTNVNKIENPLEDFGPPDIEVQVAGCLIKKVPVDGGSGVNIMIADTARALGFTNFESTPKILRMADQSRVIPLGKLPNVSVIIGDQPFRLDFIVIDPPTPSSYPMLLGRPWLYKARVRTSWGTKTFTFGSPKTTITWETVAHEGETSTTDSGYTSDQSSSTLDSRWIETEEQPTDGSNQISDSEALDCSTLFDTLHLTDVQPVIPPGDPEMASSRTLDTPRPPNPKFSSPPFPDFSIPLLQENFVDLPTSSSKDKFLLTPTDDLLFETKENTADEMIGSRELK